MDAADSRARIPNLHTLAIVELYMRLMDASFETVYFEPEPISHYEWGGRKLQPDAYIKVGETAACSRSSTEARSSPPRSLGR